MPVIPAKAVHSVVAEAGESLEPGRWRLPGAQIAPLYSSLRDRARPCPHPWQHCKCENGKKEFKDSEWKHHFRQALRKNVRAWDVPDPTPPPQPRNICWKWGRERSEDLLGTSGAGLALQNQEHLPEPYFLSAPSREPCLSRRKAERNAKCGWRGGRQQNTLPRVYLCKCLACSAHVPQNLKCNKKIKK